MLSSGLSYRVHLLALLFVLAYHVSPTTSSWPINHPRTPQCRVSNVVDSIEGKQALASAASQAAGEGNQGEAADCLVLLLQLAPDMPAVLYNYAVYMTPTHPDHAVRVLEHIREIHPGYGSGDVEVQLAALLRETHGTQEQVLNVLERGVTLVNDILAGVDDGYKGQPKVTAKTAFSLTYNLGSVYFEQGKFVEAAAMFEQAMDHDPRHPIPYLRYGQALRRQGEHLYSLVLPKWSTFFSLVSDLDPQQRAAYGITTTLLARAHDNMGNVYRILHQWRDARAEHELATSLDPTYAAAWNNLGNVLKATDERQGAKRAYQRAIEIDSGYEVAWGNLAELAFESEDYSTAVTAWRRVVEIAGDGVTPRTLLSLYNAERYVCDWRTRPRDITRTFYDVLALANATAARIGVSSATDRTAVTGGEPMIGMLLPVPVEAQRYASMIVAESLDTKVKARGRKFRYSHHVREERGDALQAYRRGDDTSPSGRLRIAYITGDIGNHPLPQSIQDIFTYHDRTKFNVTVFSTGKPTGSAIEHHIRDTVESYYDVHTITDDRDLAEHIHAHALDIVIDISGYTRGGRLGVLASRVAPVQVEWMGYTSTTGMRHISYYVGDRIVTPVVTAGSDFVEPIAYMPFSYFATHHAQHEAKMTATPRSSPQSAKDIGLPASWSTMYCSFNRLMKINAETMDMWAEVLRRVPQSYLWLLDFPSHAVPGIKNEAARRGIADQVIITPLFPRDVHLKVKSQCDVFLDTLGWNAHTTAADAVWSGIPIVTWPQRKMASRVAASIISAIVTPRPDTLQQVLASELWRALVATDRTSYINKAVRLGTDTQLRSRIRAAVAHGRDNNAAPLFDTRSWTSEWESLLTTMWTVAVEVGVKPARHIF